MRQARSLGRRHADASDTEDARDTDPYIEPEQPQREACVVLASTSHGWRHVKRCTSHREAIECARATTLPCVVRDARSWRVIYRKE